MSGELPAVDTMARVPLADPVPVCAKITVNVTLCFAESVIGKLSPLTEKPLPLRFAAEIVTADAPELVNVSERLVLLLVCRLPKRAWTMTRPGLVRPTAGFAPFLSRRAQY